MNKLGIWGIAIAAAFVVGLIISSSLAFAPPGQQGTKFQELWDAIFGLQTQFDDLEERVTALENPPPPPPPPQPELFTRVNGQDVDTFGGAQVLWVIIKDPNIDDTDEGKGEPDVEVNGESLRMGQGVDGNWYGFVSDRDNALVADFSVVNTPGMFPDFGFFCSKLSGAVIGDTIDTTSTEGFAIQNSALVTGAVEGNADATPLTNLCTAPIPNPIPDDFMAVLEGEVPLAPFPSAESAGQIGVRQGFWPFIQLYPFIEGAEVIVKYHVGGEEIKQILTFDSVP